MKQMKKVEPARARMLTLSPVMLAVAMAQGAAYAQPAQNTTSADTPEAKSLFEIGGQANIGPPPFASFLERLSSPVEKIAIKVAADNLPADGVSGVDVSVRLVDAKGDRLASDVDVTIEVNGGARILLPGKLTSESGADKGDIDRIQPGVQTLVKNGVLTFKLIAPYQPSEVTLRLSVRGVVEKVQVRYVPDLREMIAVGLVEGRLRSDKFDPRTIVPVRENDGFDNELRGFTREFNGGAGSFGMRAALYLKGKIQGKYLLTAAYDSDKETRPNLFQTIDPNNFYPVYGDSSIKGADAQSSGKLYVRLDKDRSYLLWGDFTTADNNPGRVLSQYSRSLPGLRGHYEEGDVTVNTFIAQQSFRQITDEFPARGVSGPYSVSNPNGIQGSEKIEILVRSRYQTSVILKSTALSRDADYAFEPFSGQILFRSPVPSVDDQLNPVSIRVSYEVEQGGDQFLVYGADAKLKLNNSITIGASIAKDKNPATPYTVAGANLQLKLSETTEVVAEVARSTSLVNTLANGYNTNNSANFIGKSGELEGNAVRVEIRHADADLRARAFVQRADDNFNNASSGVVGGKQDVGASLNYQVTPRISVTADGQRATDRIGGSLNESLSLAGDLKLTDRLTIGLGARKIEQNAISLAQQTTSNCLSNTPGATVTYAGSVAGYNTGFGISQTGNQQIDPATGLPVVCNTAVNPAPPPAAGLDRTAAFVRLGYQATDKLNIDGELSHVTGTNPTDLYKIGLRYAATKDLSLTGEVQREFAASNSSLYRIGADWRVAEKTRVYSRFERNHQYGGQYGLGIGPLSRAFALGVDTQYMQDGSLYSEYRLSDTASGSSVQTALGLRNGWNIAQGLKLNTNVERLVSTSGNSSAAGVGVEYTDSQLWKGSGRVEWRADDTNTNWLVTLGVARKLDRDWTLLARDYYSLLSPRSGAAQSHQHQVRLGFAYRPVDNNKFDALGAYEYKTSVDAGITTNTTHVGSVRANYHPSRPWFISGRMAVKGVREILNGVPDAYHAGLVGGRITYDISNMWSVGAITTVLAGKGGAKQYAYGVEVGYTLMDNLLVTMGYNWRGFRDDDLTGSDYTNQGWVLGLRYKFDEDLFKSKDSNVNKTLTPGGGAVKP